MREIAFNLSHLYRINLKADAVKQRAKKAGIISCEATHKPYLDDRNAVERLRFARNHQNTSHQTMRTWLITDESRINLFKDDFNLVWVKRKKEDYLTHLQYRDL